MSEQHERWMPLEDVSADTLQDQSFLACYLGKILYYYQGRNAWHWTWSSTYPGNQAFHPTFDVVCQRVERSRVQGSTWGIRELPALVFAANDVALVLTEINTTAPLSSVQDITIASRNLLDVANLFKPPRRNSVTRFIASTQLVPPAELPFNNRKSISHGGNYPLSWQTSVSDVSLQPMLNLMVRVMRKLQGEKVEPEN